MNTLNVINFCSNGSDGRNVLCTGIGMVTPLGIGRELTWQNLLSGNRAARLLLANEIDHHSALCDLLHRTPGGAPVNHEEVTEKARTAPISGLDESQLQDPLNNMIVLCLREALDDAGLAAKEIDPQRTGCVIGTSKASLRAMEAATAPVAHLESDSVRSAGRARIFAERPTGVFPSGSSNGLRGLPALGPSNAANWFDGFLSDSPLRTAVAMLGGAVETATPIAACATGLVSVIQAAELIRSGRCDVCVAGSADASLRASVLASFHRLGVTSKRNDPATACRPFDAERDGFVIGEGAAVFILESEQRAAARNASSYGKLLSGGWLTDPTGVTQIDSSGKVVAELVRQIKDVTSVQSKVEASTATPAFCSLHGTGTIPNDLAEANGLAAAFGQPVTAYGIKGAIGHLLGAAGGVEFGTVLLALRDRLIPGTTNLQSIDPDCSLKLHTAQVKTNATTAMKLSLGFGGHVAACMVAR